MADTPEMIGAGLVEGVEDTFYVGAQVQVGVANDGRGGPGGAVESGGAGRALSLNKLHFAYRTHFHGPVGTVHCPRLNEDRGHDVVASVNVVGQFLEQVALVGDSLRPFVPEVVVGIDYGDVGLKGLFLGKFQPVVASERHNGLLFSSQNCAGRSPCTSVVKAVPAAPPL